MKKLQHVSKDEVSYYSLGLRIESPFEPKYLMTWGIAILVIVVGIFFLITQKNIIVWCITSTGIISSLLFAIWYGGKIVDKSFQNWLPHKREKLVKEIEEYEKKESLLLDKMENFYFSGEIKSREDIKTLIPIFDQMRESSIERNNVEDKRKEIEVIDLHLEGKMKGNQLKK